MGERGRRLSLHAVRPGTPLSLGDKWCDKAKPERKGNLRNAHRVLLNRARQGMVIFVPPGEANDPTRTPAFYDSTFRYLAGLGIPVLDQ